MRDECLPSVLCTGFYTLATAPLAVIGSVVQWEGSRRVCVPLVYGQFMVNKGLTPICSHCKQHIVQAIWNVQFPFKFLWQYIFNYCYIVGLVLTVNSLIYCSNVQSLKSLKSVPLLVSLFQKSFTVRQTHSLKNCWSWDDSDKKSVDGESHCSYCQCGSLFNMMF